MLSFISNLFLIRGITLHRIILRHGVELLANELHNTTHATLPSHPFTLLYPTFLPGAHTRSPSVLPSRRQHSPPPPSMLQHPIHPPPPPAPPKASTNQDTTRQHERSPHIPLLPHQPAPTPPAPHPFPIHSLCRTLSSHVGDNHGLRPPTKIRPENKSLLDYAPLASVGAQIWPW